MNVIFTTLNKQCIRNSLCITTSNINNTNIINASITITNTLNLAFFLYTPIKQPHQNKWVAVKLVHLQYSCLSRT